MALDGGWLGGQCAAIRHLNLQGHQVKTGGALGDRMFHLQTGVHLEEEELTVLGGQELHGPGSDVADGRRGGARCLEEPLSHAVNPRDQW
ncbi:Uncharacterised protein [Mycobacteroides abscessus subsp. abscessus]|nr:Uncharacterised protein [Mycobacteroides abscessus subsp. abscessus]SHQ32671.1 Uncharacterised protein [Mycobacteroides abscessus subsp. abscessus]SHS60481.1 Uncharacterised protein [Mycobacteroides abscessus subsp. abscessus]SIC26903.1 Uncharacterised protein [Mycobacteroides abscessus subsp. abscessus]SKE60268.1 Uncharacterised protein [Mycobacteroides abscessus subsp. abscessus]